MAEKNQITTVEGTDVLAKSSHAILKGVYISDQGDRTWVVRNGTSASGTAIFTIIADGSHSLPNLNAPFDSGIFIDVTGGTTGRLVVVYE